jgi:hypothetical protein
VKKNTEKNLPDKLRNRRTLLTGLLSGVAGGSAGMAIGYHHQRTLEALRDEVSGAGSGHFEFRRRAWAISKAHRQQTPQVISALKAKYQKKSSPKLRVWALIDRMSQCIDLTDTRLYCTSQLLHVQQILMEMKAQGIDDPDMQLIALLHDLGKLAHLDGEGPEHVFGRAERIGEYEQGVGLDNVLFRFSHAEIIYLRVKDLVPDHVAWTLRYHNINLDDVSPYMNERDRHYTKEYLMSFRHFDSQTKSRYRVPEIDMTPYRDLVEQTFPKSIYL